jgi:prepilin-type processing-associated H-X9-DG protein
MVYPWWGPVQITTITDGTSNTILFGECSNFDPNWPQYAPALGYPANYPLSLVMSEYTGQLHSLFASGYFPLNYLLPSSPPTDPSIVWELPYQRTFNYGSGHTQGANFVFCDGSVHFISNAINNAATVSSSYGGSLPLLGALCTRDGGEVVNAAQY